MLEGERRRGHKRRLEHDGGHEIDLAYGTECTGHIRLGDVELCRKGRHSTAQHM